MKTSPLCFNTVKMITARMVTVLALLGLAACGSSGSDAPTGVVATPGPNLVTVTWKASGKDEEAFVVYRKSAPSQTALAAQTFAKLAETKPDVTTYEDKAVNPERFYQYQITARRQGRESAATLSSAVQPQAPPRQVALSVKLSGRGTVTSRPPGLSCKTKTCTGEFDEGTRVVLEPEAGANSGFVAWAGVCQGTAACEIVMDAPKEVEAKFARTAFVLKVEREGAAEGSITSSPEGIDCGKNCEQVYEKGLNVSVQAAPAEGAIFGGWSGDCADFDTELVCQLKLDKDRTAVADFTYPPPAVESFTVTPKSILAGQSARLEWRVKGKGKLKLTVSPDVGDVTGQGSVNVRPSADTTYTLKAESEFGAVEKKVALDVSPGATLTVVVTGSGSVESTLPSPNLIDCNAAGGDCAEVFGVGTDVTLQADGAVLNWTGCEGILGNACTLKMTGDKTVTATFP